MGSDIQDAPLRNPALPSADMPSPPADVSLNFARRGGDRISAQGIGFMGVAGFFMAWLLAHQLALTDGSSLVLLFVICMSMPMAFLSVILNRTHLRPSSGLNPESCAANWGRCGVKGVGLIGTLFVVAMCYALFPEYARAFYQPVWVAMKWVVFPALLLSIPYMLWTDGRMAEPKDGCWHMGSLFLGRWREVDRLQIKEHLLGWAVKGFFLPFMLAGSVEHLVILLQEGVNFSNFSYLYATTLHLLLAVDVLFGAVGYLLTFRVLDSHIRTTEPTWLGWAAALCCYAPFSKWIWSGVLKYKGKTDWMDWLQPFPVLYVSWGFAILTLLALYVWATISFGCRFSNLTNRGIIVDGPYRYFKHPAYVSKNLAWWLMYVPFVVHLTWQENLRACLFLGFTNLIYALRAWTEERHLKRDPAYRVYSQWMREHCLWAQFKRWRPLGNR